MRKVLEIAWRIAMLRPGNVILARRLTLAIKEQLP
jgi:hypothetical protein